MIATTLSRRRPLLRSALTALAVVAAVPALAACRRGARPEEPPAPAVPPPPLQGAVVLVDPGHGGLDPGAVGHGVLEKNVNLAVAIRLAADLQSGGATVYLTRETDVEPGVGAAPRNYRAGLRARRALAGQSRAAMVVSIHSNHVDAPAARGPTVFYHRDVPGSVPLARAVASQLRALAGRCPVFANGQLVLYTPGVPSINVEVGFLSNPADARRLGQPAYQAQLAQAITRGLVAYWQAVH